MSALLALVPARAWAAIVGIALVLMAAVGFVKHIQHSAADNAVQKIERANDAANQNADQAETDYYQRFDQCRSAGGSWDRANRVCLTGPGDKTLRRDPR
ncbi:hypothetical protein AB4037_08525 [Labrys sp. KB_33_2]|uniref:hypothetical protein n=1 Tax=Labrys sp. KB_33_2 TaxID=3237479 RepID=UPI003F8F2FAB